MKTSISKLPSLRADLSKTGMWGSMSFYSTSHLSMGPSHIINRFLVMRNVPYVNISCEVSSETLISSLNLAGDKTYRSDTHVIHFDGNYPLSMPVWGLSWVNSLLRLPFAWLQEHLTCKNMFITALGKKLLIKNLIKIRLKNSLLWFLVVQGGSVSPR